MASRNVCWYILPLLLYCTPTGSLTATACHGVPNQSCTQHHLNCSGGLVIDITAGSYGYRDGCSTGIGAANCEPNTVRCCTAETGDCFTSFNQTQLSQLQDTCRGLTTCRLSGYTTQQGNCNSNIRFSSYSKIDYTCINTASLSLSSTSTSLQSTSSVFVGSTVFQTSTTITPSTSTDNGVADRTPTNQNKESGAAGTVGGTLGAVIIICIVVIIIQYVYFQRRIKIMESKLGAEHHYDSAPRREGDNVNNTYSGLTPASQSAYYNLGANTSTNNHQDQHQYYNLSNRSNTTTNNQQNPVTGQIETGGAAYYDTVNIEQK